MSVIDRRIVESFGLEIVGEIEIDICWARDKDIEVIELFEEDFFWRNVSSLLIALNFLAGLAFL